MITPGLFRRSLRAGGQWRVLLLWWASLLLPTLLAALPVLSSLGALLDYSTRAKQVVAWLDGATLLELVKQLGEPQAARVPTGYLSALLVLLAIAPAMAGAMVAAASSDEPLRFDQLLGGAGELFGRMVRLALVAAFGLGIGGAIAAGAFKLASNAGEKAISATQAERQLVAATAVSMIALWLAQLTLEAGRAVFSAQPGRRSAFLAWWAGVRLIVRQPLRTLSVGLLGTLIGLGLAAVVMLARLRLEQSSAVRVVIAWALAQTAAIAIGWGKATRLVGLAELARADSADRSKRLAFQMSPPVTSPPPSAAEPPLVRSATQDALASPVLSPPDRSDT